MVVIVLDGSIAGSVIDEGSLTAAGFFSQAVKDDCTIAHRLQALSVVKRGTRRARVK